MKKAQAAALERRVRRLVAKWEPMLDLPGVVVEHRFHDKFFDSANVDATVAECVYRHLYREAVIHWYLSSIARFSNEDIEATLVHEYAHILNGAVEGGVKEKDSDLREISAENVARALLSVARGATPSL